MVATLSHGSTLMRDKRNKQFTVRHDQKPARRLGTYSEEEQMDDSEVLNASTIASNFYKSLTVVMCAVEDQAQLKC